MRAYMSTGTEHAEDGSRYTCGLNVESAEREARAILAETEPATGYYGQGRGQTRGGAVEDIQSGGIGWPVCDLALAEALAAFVGEPCQCAGGMHWSAEQGYYHCNGILSERN